MHVIVKEITVYMYTLRTYSELSEKNINIYSKSLHKSVFPTCKVAL